MFLICVSPVNACAENIPGSAPSANVRELVIIDSKVPDRQTLQDAVQEGTEVVILKEDQSAVKQITDVLVKYSELDAIHLVTHGSVGTIELADQTLNSNNIYQNREILAGWGKAIKQGGDFLIYGCNVAQGRDGRSFVYQLATALGADLAASEDLTGAASKGGNWALEYQVGEINTGTLEVANYQNTLQTLPSNGLYTFKSAVDNSDGTFTTKDGFFLITGSNGATSPPTSSVSADQYGAYINDAANNTSGTSYIEIKVKGGGSFKITSAVIGDFEPTSSAANNNFTNVYAVGLSKGIQVAVTPAHSSVGVYQTNYNLNFSNFSGKQIDAFRVYYTWGSQTQQTGFNLESISIEGASNTAPLSPNNNLSNLSLSQGTLSPVFAAATTNYTASVDNSVTSLTVTPTVADATATVKVNGVSVTSGNASGPIALNVGSNTITVLVTAQDGSTKTYTVTVNKAAPAAQTVTSVTSTTANGIYKPGDKIAVNVTFTEAVSVTGTPQLTLETGTPDQAINYSSGSGTNTLTFNYTVQAGDFSADLDYTSTSALTLNGGTIKDAAGNNAILTLPSPGAANSLGANKALVIDGVSPAVSSVSVPANGTYVAGNSLDFTVNFNETILVNTVGGLPQIALTLNTGGTVYADYVSGSGTSALTFRFTVSMGTADNDGITVGALSLNGGTLKDAAGNNAILTLNSVGSTSGVLVDGISPAVSSINRTGPAQTSANSVDFQVTFSENVTGVNAADFTVTRTGSADGSVFSVAQVNASTYTVTVNAISGSGIIRLDLNNSGTGIQDVAGNAISTGYTSGQTYTVDQTAPTVISVGVPANATYAAGNNLDFTVNFGESIIVNTVNGTPRIALTLNNGGTVYADYISGSGTSALTLRYTVTSGVADNNGIAVGTTLELNGGTLQDAAGNSATLVLNSVGSTTGVLVDAAGPTSIILVADAALRAGETSIVTITFSEAVTGFTNSDLTIANGTLSPLSSSDGGITWTATFTPTASVTDATNVITLDNTGVADAAGNAGTGTTNSNNYAIDTARPTATIVVADAALSVGETSTVTIIFSEAVTGFTNADLAVANGTLSAVSSSDGGITWTATFTPNANISDATNVITLDITGVTDAAGNAGSGTIDGNNYAIDSVRPTASVVMNDSALRMGETSLVTITFSEAVTGFTLADLTVANGTLTGLSSSDGGITWTATFTPTAGITDATNLITLANTGVSDLAGNTGSGTTVGNNYAIDTARPTTAVVISDAALIMGETSLVTFTFSEAVTGFTNADLTIANGTLSAVSSSDGGITWTATFTPTAGITDATNLITLDNTGVSDAAGNAGSGTTDGNNYAIDTAAPTLTITSNVSALKTGETATITFTFSENPDATFAWDGTAGDIVVAGGTLSAISGSGFTRTAIFTPMANINGGTASITVAAGSYSDAAGNSGEAGSTPAITFDTQEPAAPSTPNLADASDSGSSNSDNITNVTTPVFSGTAEANSTVTLYDTDGTSVLGTTTATGGNWAITSATLSSGAHTLTAKATDAAGNVSPASSGLSLTIDNTPPAATLVLTPANGATVTTGTPVISGTAEANSIVSVYIDGAEVNSSVAVAGSGNWSYTPAALANGSHTITARAMDIAGNAGTLSSVTTITVNTSPTLNASATFAELSTNYGAVSASQNFNITATNLIEGVLVTPPAGFEVSLNNSSFSSALTLGGTGDVSSTIVYIRLSNTASAGNHTGNITLSSAGATIVNVPLPATNTVSKATLTITATGINKVYDGSNAATVTLSDDRIADDVLTLAYTGAAFDNKNVGVAKPVTVSGITISGADAGNYTFNSTAGTTADITAKTLAVTATASDKVYDGNTTATISLSDDRVTGDELVVVNSAANFGNKNTGSGKTVNITGITISGTDAGNYTVNSTTTATAAITAKALTVTATASDKVYDGNTTATISLSDDRVTGDELVVVNSAANFDNKNAGSGKTVNISGITISGTDSGNYTVNSTTTATAGITAKSLTVTATASDKVYDGNTTATISLSDDRVTGDELAVVNSAANFETKNTGSGKTVNVTGITIRGTDAGNYTANSTTTATAAIAAKALTVTATASDKVYDGNTTATISLSDDRVTGDELVIVNSAANFDNKNAGSGKTVNVTGITISGTDAGNYSVNTTTTATAAITTKALTITATASDKVYDGNTTATVNLSDDRIAGDELTITNSAASFDNKNVGNSKTVLVSGITISGADAGNYTANTTGNTTASITKASVTITAEDKEKIQGLPLPAFTASYSGFVNGESESVFMTPLVFTIAADAMSPQGTYSITVGGATAQNYNISFVPGTLTVKPGYPTAISVVASTLFENSPAGTLAGSLGSASDDPSATFTYSMVNGAGDTDNSLFVIQGQELKTAGTLDYEKKNNYSIRVRSTTQYGLYLDRTFQIALSDVNEVPTLAPVADETICYITAPMAITMGGISPGPELGQKVTLTITSDNAGLFEQLKITDAGKVTYQVKAGQQGTANVTVSVQDNGGTANGGIDISSRTFKITVNPLPVVSIVSDKGAVISKGETVQLTASGGTLYSWNNPGGVIAGQQSATVTVRPAETTTYRVLVKTAAGCSESKEFTIQVQDDYKVVDGTNLLSPNGDGVNDRFIIRNIDMYPNNTVKIFDRAGRLLYSKKNYTDEWDGTFQGSPLAEGTYYYIVDFGQRQLKGFITIVRN